MHSIEKAMHRYKVYLKVMTPSLSGSKGCLVFSICLQCISRVCVCSLLQQLQGVEAVKDPLGQVGDLISIQHAGGDHNTDFLKTREMTTEWIFMHDLGAGATYRELRERSPWKASGAISEIWLLLRSLR